MPSNIFGSCYAHLKRAEREFFQPPPYPSDLVFHDGGLSHRAFPAPLFPGDYPPPFTQFKVFPEACWVQRFCLVKYDLRAVLPSLPRIPRLPGWCPNVVAEGTVPKGKQFALMVYIV